MKAKMTEPQGLFFSIVRQICVRTLDNDVHIVNTRPLVDGQDAVLLEI